MKSDKKNHTKNDKKNDKRNDKKSDKKNFKMNDSKNEKKKEKKNGKKRRRMTKYLIDVAAILFLHDRMFARRPKAAGPNRIHHRVTNLRYQSGIRHDYASSRSRVPLG